MPSALSALIRRPPGTGWLILSGSTMQEALILRALAVVDQAGIIVAVAPTTQELPEAEVALQNWLDLSGWDGRAVDCDASDALEDALSEAALVILPDLADSGVYARTLGQTDASEFLLAALDAGVVIVAEGSPAEALGELTEFSPADRTENPALRWLPGAIVQTHFSDDQPRSFHAKRKELFRIGLPEAVAMAIGPNDEREIWGNGKPTITFQQWWKE
jgi:hypothetical protein